MGDHPADDVAMGDAQECAAGLRFGQRAQEAGAPVDGLDHRFSARGGGGGPTVVPALPKRIFAQFGKAFAVPRTKVDLVQLRRYLDL